MSKKERGDNKLAHCNAVRGGLASENSRRELVPVSYLVSCLQRSITLSVFDGQHQVAVRGFVGYHSGSLHGTIITTTGSVRQIVATLAVLDTNDARHGMTLMPSGSMPLRAFLGN
jgi:hypothetical protein